ncbi:fimbrial chaperone protein, partial [Escherichia coli]
TPYYFAIISVKQNGTAIKVSEDIKDKLSVFAPGEKVSLGKSVTSNSLSIVAFDDYGVDKEYKLNKS